MTPQPDPLQPRPTPKQREAIFRKLGQSGRGGMSESVVSQETAIPLGTVREALRLMRLSGAVEQNPVTLLWRTKLRGEARA